MLCPKNSPGQWPRPVAFPHIQVTLDLHLVSRIVMGNHDPIPRRTLSLYVILCSDPLCRFICQHRLLTRRSSKLYFLYPSVHSLFSKPQSNDSFRPINFPRSLSSQTLIPFYPHCGVLVVFFAAASDCLLRPSLFSFPFTPFVILGWLSFRRNSPFRPLFARQCMI
jgi:hypothetical protein